MSRDYESVLSDELLQHCAERAAKYDAENSFFFEDFEQLKAAGYLNGPVPKELGGGGLTLARSCAEQTRLAYHAPATALAINMHLYWVGVAADLWRWGDKSLEWLLTESIAGEVIAAGHSERGNDLPIFLSTATATKADGGYRFSGHKMFGSLTPVWTRFGIHAMEADHADGPQIIHAFMPREAEGYTIKETWDVLGMRATRSDDTILDDVFVEDKYIARTVPAGQGVQMTNQAGPSHGFAIDRRGNPALEVNLDVGRIVGGVGHPTGPFVGVFGGLQPRVLQFSSLHAAAPQVLIDGEPAPVGVDGQVALLTVLDLVFPAHSPIACGSDDFDVRPQRGDADLQPDLVVTLAGATVGDGVGAVLPRRLHQAAGDKGPS